MSDIQYTYAVARIRSLEVSLFSAAVLEQLLACKDEQQCLAVLAEKGWGDNDTPAEADAILKRETEKAWETIRELQVDMSLFEVLSLPRLFHNLKAAVKEACTKKSNEYIYYQDTELPRDVILPIVKAKKWNELPEFLQEPAKEAFEELLRTKDGQMCDVIIDQATLKAIYKAGLQSPEEVIRQYTESTVAVTDIKIAVRAARTGKNIDFMRQALAECASLNIDSLIQAALGGQEPLSEYLARTPYAEAAEAIKASPSVFECWCDNQLIETIRPQKYNPFSAGPLIAYLLARMNEIKTVKIILTGKQNGLSDDSIRERLREMYV